MPLKFEPPIASTQENIIERNENIEDGNLERFRTISMYTMMFLSMASPILYESYLLAWYIDLLSTLGFMLTVVLTHAKEIKKFGPVVLPTAGLLSVIVFASRVSLLEIMPWIPFAISMWLLITVYSCPAFLALIQEVIPVSGKELSENSHCFRNVAQDIEEDQCQATVFDFNQRIPPKSISNSAMNRDLAFMGRPASIISTKSSDIDLDEGNTMGKSVAARFLPDFRGEDATFMNFPKEVRFHSRDMPIHFLEIPEDSLKAHYSTNRSKIHEYT